MKRICSLLLLVVLTIGLICSCSNNQDSLDCTLNIPSWLQKTYTISGEYNYAGTKFNNVSGTFIVTSKNITGLVTAPGYPNIPIDLAAGIEVLKPNITAFTQSSTDSVYKIIITMSKDGVISREEDTFTKSGSNVTYVVETYQDNTLIQRATLTMAPAIN